MHEREAFLRRFHAARPGITSAAFAGRDTGDGRDSYDRLAAAAIAAAGRGSRVLDLGCGDGYLLGKLGPRAIGVDLAPSRGGVAAPAHVAGHIAAASEGGSGATLVAGAAQALPFAAAAFDACVCHLAFMLFDALDRVVGELRRVVVPGGVFAAVLGGGPTAAPIGDDAFHRFLAIARPRGQSLGDRRAASEPGWRALFGTAPALFERFEVDLSGDFAAVWRLLGASYQLDPADAPAIRARLAAHYAGHPTVPCRVVMWLATVRL